MIQLFSENVFTYFGHRQILESVELCLFSYNPNSKLKAVKISSALHIKKKADFRFEKPVNSVTKFVNK